MHKIEELIQYHNECEFLDFKIQEYTAKNKHSLIKDVLSFANANTVGDRYIIIGVSKKDGKITLNEIESQLDSANIQQMIHENIRPELGIEYTDFCYDNTNLMVLTVKEPLEKPYSTKKAVFGDGSKPIMNSDEFWIRKGSFQKRMTQEDFDSIYQHKYKKMGFLGEVFLTFPGTGTDSEEIVPISTFTWPSDAALKRIQERIDYLEKLRDTNPLRFATENSSWRNPLIARNHFNSTLNELQYDKANIKSDYDRSDLYYLEETISHKLNLEILNQGEEFLEETYLQLEIPKVTGLIVVPELPLPIEKSARNEHVFYSAKYPNVEDKGAFYIVSLELGNLRHNVKQLVFPVPLRIVFCDSMEVDELSIKCEIFAKNLSTSIKQELNYIIVRKELST